MKTYKKGISLIVLVITVIVLAILATTVIISLSNTNIMGQASDAVNKHNLQSYNEQAALAYASWKIENKSGELTNIADLKVHGFDASELPVNFKATINNGVPNVLSVDVWDGTSVDTDWEGSGTSDDPYIISTAAELAGIAVYEGGNEEFFELTQNINLNNKDWTPIEGYYYFFGNNHTIFGLNVSNKEYAGLFGDAGSSGIDGVIIDGGNINGSKYAGAIAANGSWVTNCKNINTVVTSSTGVAGGIVGMATYVNNSDNYGNVSGKFAAGIGTAGTWSEYMPLELLANCNNYGSIHGITAATGIHLLPGTYHPNLGAFAEAELINCFNYGTVTVDSGGTIIE